MKKTLLSFALIIMSSTFFILNAQEDVVEKGDKDQTTSRFELNSLFSGQYHIAGYRNYLGLEPTVEFRVNFKNFGLGASAMAKILAYDDFDLFYNYAYSAGANVTFYLPIANRKIEWLVELSYLKNYYVEGNLDDLPNKFNLDPSYDYNNCSMNCGVFGLGTGLNIRLNEGVFLRLDATAYHGRLDGMQEYIRNPIGYENSSPLIYEFGAGAYYQLTKSKKTVIENAMQ